MTHCISIVGTHYYFGSEIFKVGQTLTLKKDYENRFDDEAIQVNVLDIGKAGYVANSVKTVAKGTKSAGRIYDSFGEETKCIVKFIVKDTVIAEIVPPKQQVSESALME